jgi:hypothetical protein
VDPNTVDNFIDKVVPNLTGMGTASVCIKMATLKDNFTGPHATPGVDGIKETFLQINGSQQICFDVIPKMNTAVPNLATPQFLRAQLQVKGVGPNGTTVNLGNTRDVFFLIPPVIMNGPI